MKRSESIKPLAKENLYLFTAKQFRAEKEMEIKLHNEAMEFIACDHLWKFGYNECMKCEKNIEEI